MQAKKSEMEDWAKVYKSTNVIDAEMVKAMLLDQGIEAVVVNKIDRSLIFGEAYVYCPAADESLAKTYINQNPEESND